MSFTAQDHPEARAEYLDAVDYYDAQRPGLGDELIRRFEEAIEAVIQDPDAWPRVPEWDGSPALHSHGVKVFPYRIVYYTTGEQVRIIAYAHTRREPEYWRQRIGT